MPEPWGHPGWVIRDDNDPPPIDFHPGDKIIYQMKSEYVDRAIECGWIRYDKFVGSLNPQDKFVWQDIRAYKIMRNTS